MKQILAEMCSGRFRRVGIGLGMGVEVGPTLQYHHIASNHGKAFVFVPFIVIFSVYLPFLSLPFALRNF